MIWVPMTINTTSAVASPCVRHCCLNDNDVCLGCFRTLDEIKDWQSKSDSEKIAVLALCQKRQKSSTNSQSRSDTFDVLKKY